MQSRKRHEYEPQMRDCVNELPNSKWGIYSHLQMGVDDQGCLCRVHPPMQHTAHICSTLKLTATHCILLQHTATRTGLARLPTHQYCFRLNLMTTAKMPRTLIPISSYPPFPKQRYRDHDSPHSRVQHQKAHGIACLQFSPRKSKTRGLMRIGSGS